MTQKLKDQYLEIDDNCDFIYLMPGNWLELRNINMDKTYPYDIETLKTEILSQVNNRTDKLSFIDSIFNNKYNVTEEITFYLDKSKFLTMIDMIKAEKIHPIITFHGTSLAAVNSILESGYVIPTIKNDKNIVITKKHGSMYGTGVYSSPFFGKSMGYTITDDTKCVYVIINLVFLGKMKLIPPISSQNIKDIPKNGSYQDGSNTRIVFGLEQLVCSDCERIIPIAVMKIYK